MFYLIILGYYIISYIPVFYAMLYDYQL